MTIVPELRAELMRAAAIRSSPEGGRALAQRLRRLGLPLIGGLLLGTAGVATSAGLIISSAVKERSAQLTTEPVTPDKGERAGIGPDLAELATSVQREIPYPPGVRDRYDWAKYPAGPTLGTNQESRREVRIVSEARAACLWRIYFLEQHDLGDTKAATEAVSILKQIPEWPTMRSDSGSPDPHLVALADAAASGRTEELRRDVSINCDFN